MKVNYVALPVFPSTYRDPAQEYKVIGKLREELYGSGFSPAVFLAESKQALGMIGNAAVRVGAAVAALRARDPRALFIALGIREPRKKFSRDLKNQSKDLSSLWLEVNYGWLPLFSDAEDGAKWIAEALEGRAGGKTRLVKSRNWQETTYYTGPLQDTLQYTKRETFYGYKVIATGVARQHHSLPSIMTVAEVAWEKLPYSFVADWWLPIGSYISALKTAGDISGTFVETRTREHVYSGIKPVSGYMYVSMPLGTESRTEYSLARAVTKELKVANPFSSFLDKDQSYKSWQHAANAVALIVQNSGSRLASAYAGIRGRGRYTE